ncbi:MAG: holo-ACP synthase [Halanaerobium sp.]
MILGTGIDIVKNSRIENLIKKYGDNFLNRIYLKSEINYCSSKTDKTASYAARFAAKEAFFKALGTGKRKHSWKDIEIVNDKLGKPEVKLYGRTSNNAESMEVKKIFLSISHENEYTVAQIILEGE